jgi:oligoendopeptidase F
MFAQLPRDPLVFIHWDWNQLRPFADDFAQRTITPASIAAWVMDWSDLNRVIAEIFARLWVATTLDTTDQGAKIRFNTFLDKTYMPSVAANQALKLKLLDTGLELEGLEIPLRNMRVEAEIYREENLPLLAEDRKLENEYDEIIAAQTVEWEGREVTTTQLQPVYLDLARETREKAWRLEMERKLSDRQRLNDLWVKMLEVREQVASQADFPDYRSYRWKELLRLDYTPEDCLEFHRAVKQVAVPAATRIYKKRQERLNLPSLRPWDLNVDPLGRSPLKPFTAINELVGKVSAIYHQIDPERGFLKPCVPMVCSTWIIEKAKRPEPIVVSVIWLCCRSSSRLRLACIPM